MSPSSQVDLDALERRIQNVSNEDMERAPIKPLLVALIAELRATREALQWIADEDAGAYGGHARTTLGKRQGSGNDLARLLLDRIVPVDPVEETEAALEAGILDFDGA